jgi:hypothetical protein
MLDVTQATVCRRRRGFVGYYPSAVDVSVRHLRFNLPLPPQLEATESSEG